MQAATIQDFLKEVLLHALQLNRKTAFKSE